MEADGVLSHLFKVEIWNSIKIIWQYKTFCECPKNSPPQHRWLCLWQIFECEYENGSDNNVDDKLMYVDKDDGNDNDDKNDDDNDEDLTAASVWILQIQNSASIGVGVAEQFLESALSLTSSSSPSF